MNDDSLLIEFEKRIRREVNYKKFLNSEILEKMYSLFPKRPLFINSNNFLFSLEDIKTFYKYYNINYYEIIVNGFNNNRITISKDIKISHVSTLSNDAYIKLTSNDIDLFSVVHELAHFIDCNTNPHIIDDRYNIYAEVFSLYMEKKYEIYLRKISSIYNNVILTRRNNRLFYEKNYLFLINLELYYENLYKKYGYIPIQKVDIDDVRRLMKLNYINIVNFLLRYPIGNILSDYLLENEDILLNGNICCKLNEVSISDEFDNFIDRYSKKIVKS